jgi:hypothetical protein
MKPRIGQRARRWLADVSLVGSDLPGRIRATAFAILGLTTAAGLGLVLLFTQATLPIPSLGPVTQPLPGHQAVHGGIALGTAGASRAVSAPAGSAPTSSTSLPSAVPAAAAEFAAAGTTPQGGGGVGDTAAGGAGIAGNQQELAAVQPQTSPVPSTTGAGPGSAPAADEAPAQVTSPVSEPAPAPPPSAPGVPTSEPPVVEPELPVEELPEGEAPEEPPVVEPPVEEEEEEDADGFLRAVGQSRGAL